MSAFKSREEELKRSIRYRDRIVFLGSLCLLAAISGLAYAPHVIDVYQSPDPRYGRVSRAGDVPVTTAWLFAEYIFCELNLWKEDGAEDYENNRKRLAGFITKRYHREIREDIARRLESKDAQGFNELTGRTRQVSLAPGAAFSDKAVEVLGPGAWTVYLDLHVEEFIDDRPVKETYVRFPLRVVLYRISREYNNYQLALDGFSATPERLTYDDPDVATDEHNEINKEEG